MTLPLIKTSFSSGEVDPAFYGRPDVAAWHNGCSTARNGFVNVRGGFSSRAGTSWVGPCFQAGTLAKPRDIPFQFSSTQGYNLEFGDNYMTVVSNGAYVLESQLAITGATATNPCSITVPGNSYNISDMIYITGVEGMPALNNRYARITTISGDILTLDDFFFDNLDAVGYGTYTSGGTVARVYKLTTPYAAVDLPYLKYTQSVDVMTLTCVNPETGTEYPTYDLTRYSATSWSLTATTYGSSMSPPTGLTATATNTTPPTTSPPTQLTWYAYCVTSVNAETGDESIASSIVYVQSVELAAIAGSIVLTWNAVTGASYYNVYKAPAAYDASVPVGSVFGLAGTSYGTQLVDTNITQDFTKTPPLHSNPFARGQISQVTVTAGGSGYTQAGVTYSISTSTGSGAVLAPVVVGGAVVAVIVLNPGSGYRAGNTVTFTGDGTGATATLSIGPQTGTYPSVANYFQTRRVYANTLNAPATLFFSQTGRYTNMDAGTIPVDSDAIVSTPWGQQVNGVQWLLPMPGGLIVATGLDAWQVTGTGGAFSPITPSSQSAQAQEAYGFSTTVKPIKIGYNILYPTRYNNAIRELEYNFFANIYGGKDISFLSSHLFTFSPIVDSAWSREPNKLIWMVREDGKGVCLTYVKEQQISGYTRYDTNGLFQTVCAVSEPPVDAIYFTVKRYIPGKGKWVYYKERMDDRIWNGPEDCWCVDAGLALAQPTPNAVLSASAVDGTKGISGGTIIAGGSNYTAPTVTVIDPTGSGNGASIGLTVVGGVITAINVLAPGENYGAVNAIISDSTGHGGAISLSIDRNVTFTASAGVFSSGSVGQVIRMNGGIGVVTTYVSTTSVVASMRAPILVTMPNDPNNLPVPADSGTWTLTQPVSQITNLEHLEGMTVSIVADGGEVAQQTVSNGTITLPSPASQVLVGLPFLPQVQGLHAEVQGGPTVQDKRKRASMGTIRVDRSRGVQIGVNQPIAATQQLQQDVPWSHMQEIKEWSPFDVAGNALPLFTGDHTLPLDDDWNTTDGQSAAPGMMAAQQPHPFPMNITCFIYEFDFEDKQG
jgi:hypothetical protein